MFLSHLLKTKGSLMKIFFLLVTALFISNTSAVDPCKFSHLHSDLENPEVLQIMTFNAYWLYDREDDPNVEYDQKYKPSDYEGKLTEVAQIINKHRPDVLALQEVENRAVLIDLLKFLNRPMAILHYDSMDNFTGQDVALLYNPDKLVPSSELKSNLEYAADLKNQDGEIIVPQRTLAKGILEIELKVKATDEKIVFLVTHLKSQLGGWNADLKRIAQANTLRKKIEEVMVQNKKIFLMGDFNDSNPSPSIEMITGESKFIYDFDGQDTFLMYDTFVDYEQDFKAPAHTNMHKKFIKAGGKMRYMGTFFNRIDYIFRSPWISRQKILGLCIDQSYDLSKRKPSDHYPLILTYSSKFPETQE